jgi:cardiolipin synthase
MAFVREEIERIYGAPFVEGNRVELLTRGGPAFRRIFEAVGQAREFVLLQFYIYRNDETGMELAELLKEKASGGVSVCLLYDHLGSFGTPRRFWHDLRRAGVRVRASHPFRPFSPGRYLYRDHRKVLVVDARTAFTGGLNIANEYRGMPRRKKEPWRDTGIMVEGPLASALAGQFARAWRTWGGETMEFPPPPPPVPGGLPLIPIFAHSSRGRRSMRRLLYYSINHAREEICLTTAYFTPSRRMLQTLEAAVRRGVRVRLLVPGTSDVTAAHYAGRAFFSRLLGAGVEIHAYLGPMMHAKTYIFDRAWSIVGSANLDFLSMRRNDEGNVGILDEGFARSVKDIFREDTEYSLKITPEAWAGRPHCERVLERASSLLRRRL